MRPFKPQLYSLLFVLFWTSTAHAIEVDNCFRLAARYMEILGIKGDFDTRLRVERKSTNTEQQTEEFLGLIRRTLDSSRGESFAMRDRPSSEKNELVTATTYPFSRRVQNALRARIRLREYGERPIGSSEPWESTTKGFVSLEIKARTERTGVVVKPILKVSKKFLPDLFKDFATFTAARERLLRENLGDATNNPALVKAVLETVEMFYQKSEELGDPMVADTIEYSRQAYVLKAADKDGKLSTVQLTFDRGVSLFSNVDPTLSPFDVSRSSPTLRYPSGERAVVVVEMKSDLGIDGRFQLTRDELRLANPTYVKVREGYEKLQLDLAPGFEADSGKAAQLKTENWE